MKKEESNNIEEDSSDEDSSSSDESCHVVWDSDNDSECWEDNDGADEED